jgi:hypothetical protein
VNQHHIAQALIEYYRKPMPSHGRYAAHYGRNRQAATSILTVAIQLVPLLLVGRMCLDLGVSR